MGLSRLCWTALLKGREALKGDYFLHKTGSVLKLLDRHKTAFSSAKILAYIAAITLHVDEFSVDLYTIAQDLQMDVKRYERF